MDDLDLLKLAAKAAGLNLEGESPSGGFWVWDDGDAKRHVPWSPLTDDADALQLAIKLTMSVEICEHESSTYAYAGDVPRVYAMELWRGDRDAATRRAIVRAAAEIGKRMEQQTEGAKV